MGRVHRGDRGWEGWAYSRQGEGGRRRDSMYYFKGSVSLKMCWSYVDFCGLFGENTLAGAWPDSL